MGSFFYRLNKKLDSLLNDSGVYFEQHPVARLILLLSIIGASSFVVALPLILKIAGLSTLYFLILAVAWFILVILIALLAWGTPPAIKQFCLMFGTLRKFISSVTKAVSFLPATIFTPPRLRATV